MIWKLPFRIIPAGARASAQIVCQCLGLAHAFTLIGFRPAVMDPAAPQGIVGVEVDVVSAPGPDQDPDAFKTHPDKPDDPHELVRLMPFSTTRLAVMVQLSAALPAEILVWVDRDPTARLAVYVGDAVEGKASDALLKLVYALGERLRPLGIPVVVNPYNERPDDAALPILSPLEAGCALYAGQNAEGTIYAIKQTLPAVLGIEFRRVPEWEVLAFVAPTASPEFIADIHRVLPEYLVPGYPVRVVPTGAPKHFYSEALS